MNYSADKTSPALPVRSWRNGLLVRLPDSPGKIIKILPNLQRLSEMLPEYCGLFAAIPGELQELCFALKFIDDTIALSPRKLLWRREEIASARQFRAGAALLLNDSLADKLSLRLAKIPQLLDARNLPPPSTNKLQFSPMLKYNDLNPDLRSLHRHQQLLLLNFDAVKNFPQIDFVKVLDTWVRAGGIAVITGTPQQTVTAQQYISQLPQSKVYCRCGISTGELLPLLLAARGAISGGDDLLPLAPTAFPLLPETSQTALIRCITEISAPRCG